MIYTLEKLLRTTIGIKNSYHKSEDYKETAEYIMFISLHIKCSYFQVNPVDIQTERHLGVYHGVAAHWTDNDDGLA